MTVKWGTIGGGNGIVVTQNGRVIIRNRTQVNTRRGFEFALTQIDVDTALTLGGGGASVIASYHDDPDIYAAWHWTTAKDLEVIEVGKSYVIRLRAPWLALWVTGASSPAFRIVGG